MVKREILNRQEEMNCGKNRSKECDALHIPQGHDQYIIIQNTWNEDDDQDLLQYCSQLDNVSILSKEEIIRTMVTMRIGKPLMNMWRMVILKMTKISLS